MGLQPNQVRQHKIFLNISTQECSNISLKASSDGCGTGLQLEIRSVSTGLEELKLSCRILSSLRINHIPIFNVLPTVLITKERGHRERRFNNPL